MAEDFRRVADPAVVPDFLSVLCFFIFLGGGSFLKLNRHGKMAPLKLAEP